MGRFMSVCFISVCGTVVLSGFCVSAASAQLVRTPHLDSFSTRTAVGVPDGGEVQLGGIRRSSRGHARYGTPGTGYLPGWNRLFGNRAWGGADSSGVASVRVTVIDHESLDQQVLAEARRRRPGRSKSPSEGAKTDLTEFSRRLSRHVESTAEKAEGLLSVAEIRRRNAQEAEQQRQEVRRLVAEGRRAEEKHRPAVAKHLYHMAHRRAAGTLKERLGERLD